MDRKRRLLPHSGKLAAGLCLLLAAASLLLFPGQIRTAVEQSLLYCLTALVPSLFPFLALSAYAVRSGAGELLGRPLASLTRRLFRLPSSCAVPLLLSFFGGYPAGARGVSLLLEQKKLTERQAGHMMLFCLAPGPAFAVTFLGGTVLRSFRAGWLLFWSVTLSGLLLGVFSSCFVTKEKEPEAFPSASENISQSDALVRSVSDASRSTVTMCACILLFSAFSAVLHGSGVFQLLSRLLSRTGLFSPLGSSALLSFLLEVTGGVGDAAKFRVAPAFYAFGLAFGGLCVHLQVFSFFRKFPLPFGKFFLFRFLHGGLSAGLFTLLSRLLPTPAEQTLSTAGPVSAVSPLSATAAGGLSLLLMCLAFLLIVSKSPDAGRKQRPGNSRL